MRIYNVALILQEFFMRSITQSFIQFITFAAFAIGLALPASAQMVQQVAVGVCQSSNDSKEAEFDGASFLIPSNMNSGADFICPIDGVDAHPTHISSVTVYLGDPSVTEDASVELCFTALNSTPSEICGPPAYSVGAGYFAQAIKAGPPPLPRGSPLNAFIKVYIPQPNPPGYGFLRGFEVN